VSFSIREPQAGVVVAVELESGKRLLGETVLFSVGRTGDNRCPPPRPGPVWAVDKRGRIGCNRAVSNDCATHLRRRRRGRAFPAIGEHRDGARGAELPATCSGREVRAVPIYAVWLVHNPGNTRWSARTKSSSPNNEYPTKWGWPASAEIARGQNRRRPLGAWLKLLFHP